MEESEGQFAMTREFQEQITFATSVDTAQYEKQVHKVYKLYIYMRNDCSDVTRHEENLIQK